MFIYFIAYYCRVAELKYNFNKKRNLRSLLYSLAVLTTAVQESEDKIKLN